MAKTVEWAESSDTPHAVWIVDTSGATVSVSPAVCELLGLDGVAADGQKVEDLITVLDTSRADSDADERWLHLLLDTPTGVSLMEAREQPRFGADGALESTAYHLLTPGSRTAHLLRQVDLMVEAQQIAHVGSWYWYPAADEIWWSEELYRLYRVDPGSSPSVEDSQRLIHPEDRVAMEAAVASAFAGQPHIEWEGRLLLPEGGVRWIREVADAEFDAQGNLVRLCGTAQDITELRRAATLAAEAQERLILMQTVAEGAVQTATLAEVIELTVRAVIQHTYWEPVTAHLLAGWMAADVTVPMPLPRRDPDTEPTTVGSEASEQLLASVQESAQVTAVPISEGTERRTLAGVPVVLNSEAVAVLQFKVDDPDGLDEQTVNVLNQLAALLASVAEREHAAHSLREARDAATLAAARKAELLAVMSHEIRTPMSGALGLIDLLLETPLDDRQLRMAIAMREAGDALLRVVNAVLDLSRADSGRLVAKTKEFDIRAVVEGAVAMLAPTAYQKGLELVLDIDRAVGERVIGDADLLSQAITNLCANAVKFTDEGYVRIAVGPDLEDPMGEALSIVVSDTGVGIANAETGWVFEAFAQSDQSSTRYYDGSGLGLSITKAIAETLGGSIRVRSEVGVGSSFTMSVPLPAADTKRPPRPWLEDTAVLLSEPHPVAARALSRLFEAAGAEVTARPTIAGLDAELGTWSTSRPRRLVVVDGDLAGARLAEIARRAEHDAQAAMVVLVPAAAAESEESARDLVLTAVTKPVRRDTLTRAIHQAFGDPPLEVAPTGRGDDQPARPLFVLIVEDNPVNQLVAAGVVESLGHRVAVVDNGNEASALLQTDHPYDLVLMDCRMPGMDGYETTRITRENEAGSGRHVPIVALTASVLLDEQERAFDSGMDGVLAKPIDREKLSATLQLWGNQPRVTTTGSHDLAPLLAVDRVRELRSLSKDGVDLFSRARRTFLDTIEGDLTQLGEAVADESGALPRLAHALAGSAQTVGLARLGRLLSTLERRCAEEPSEVLHRRFEEITLTARASLATLREF
ncbi:response regulator [Nocardioides sp. Bht2]|uniref:hybrid sensor histidine kinase/response regulator n=1 Tax=Nocardioides sp. Bht2 TaxID=3392297 RepID=UPI0039B6AB7C